MKYQVLKNIIKPTNKELTLEASRFSGSGIEVLFQSLFQSTSINITEAEVTPDDKNEAITLIGRFMGTLWGIETLANRHIGLEAVFDLFGETPIGKFTFTFVDEWSLADALSESVFGEILADLKIDSHQQLLNHPIEKIGVDSSTLSFTVAINPEISLHFSDIPKYLQGTSVESQFPSTDNFPSFATNLTFKSFEFAATLDPLGLNAIGLEVRLEEEGASWKTMANLVEFKELHARFLLLNPLGTPVVNIELGATAAIANKDIMGHIFLPSKDFQINLAPDEEISIKEMLESITKADIPGMPTISCTRFGVIGSPENKTYEIYATIRNVMEVDIGKSVIKVEELDADFTFDTGEDGETTGAFEGKISFDNAKFFVIVEDQGDEGWLISGGTDSDQSLHVGTLMEELVEKIGSDNHLPGPLQDLTIKNLSISFNTKTHDFIFGCAGDFPIEGKEVAIILNIILTKQEDGTYKKDFEGVIDVGPFTKAGILDFDLHFIKDSQETLFAATFSHKNAPLDMSLGDIIKALSANIDDIPIDLSVDLKDIILIFEKKQEESAKFLFALDIGVSVNLSHLPLIGKQFPPDKSVGFENLQFLLASAEIPKTDIEKWGNENLLPADKVTPLPNREMKKGLGIDGKLNLGPLEAPVSLPITGSGPPPAPSSPPQTATPPGSKDKAKWFTIQKKIGPIDFERVGMMYTDGELWLLLDAALAVGGLTIGLQGLSVRSSLKKFNPKFSLNGLGVDFKKGTLEIGGAFLKVPDPGPEVQFEYDGTAVISIKELMIAALGSYAVLADNHKSLFIYGILEFPIGGPPFFFVTGVAAGFGYNRRLIAPAIDQVANFPLVAEAVNGAKAIPSGTGAKDALSAELAKLRTYIIPEEDQYFLAVGIKFTSFKIIDSFALLTVSFGHHFELDVLGLSTLLLPTPEADSEVEPLAEVQLALKVSFIPDEGFLGIEAQLTAASFLLSRKCHLTGGFAFYSWFSGRHKGDFVITIGGYHPSFQKPDHYPNVPRLGFNWQVSKKFSLKGEAYFALTASAVMAGARFEALWDGGALKAWFIIGADFLIAWKPYHYDARVYVDMGVSYTFHLFGTHTLSLDLGADLHIWGPDFSGTAKIKLWIFTIPISFGAGASQKPQPIDWPTFRSSFLPDDDQEIVSISIKEGLKKEGQAGSVDWVVATKNISFVIDTLLPLKQVTLGTNAPESSGQEAFGISPMDLSQDKVSSSLKIRVTNADPTSSKPADIVDFTHNFSLVPITKNVPKGLWGESVSPNMNGQKFISDAITGYQLILEAEDEEPATKPAPIDRHKFEFSTKNMDDYIQPQPLADFAATYPDNWRDLLKKDMQANALRDDILSALGMDMISDTNLVDGYVNELILSPQFS